MQMLKDLIKNDDEEMENFDPMAELSDINRQLSNNPGGESNIAQTRDTWKMNYKMKNQNMKKAEKDNLVKELVIGKLKDLMVDQVAKPLIQDTKETIKKID